MAVTRRALLASLILCGWPTGASAQRLVVDYFYGHIVSGTVETEDGRPVPDAVVQRTVGPDGREPYGLTSLYKRTTGERGGFRFAYRGMGPRPTRHQTWHLAVQSDHCDAHVETVEVPWERGIDGASRGYVREGIVLRLSGCHDLPPPPPPDPVTAALSRLPAPVRVALARAVRAHHEAQELRRRSIAEVDRQLGRQARVRYAEAAARYTALLPLPDPAADLEVRRNRMDAYWFGGDTARAVIAATDVRDRTTDPAVRAEAERILHRAQGSAGSAAP